MDNLVPNSKQNSGIVYRLNVGYRLRIGGETANNDGIQADMDIGYRSRRFCQDRFSLESGSSVDLFGETEHLGAYLQFNYHLRDSWILSVRALGGGVSDDKETNGGNVATASGDSDDFGGIYGLFLMGGYRLDENFVAGVRGGYLVETFGKGGGDQGTQHSLMGLLSLAYLF